MKKCNTLQKSVSVYVGLNIQIVDDDGRSAFLHSFPLLSLTWALMLLWSVANWLRVAGYTLSAISLPSVSFTPLVMWWASFVQSAGVVLTLLQIGFRATLYGVGVPV